MEITPSLIIQPASVQDASPAALKSWQVGQILSATVVAATGNGSVTLRINNLVLSAQTPLDLQAGQTLKLEVARGGDQPVLKIAQPPPAPPTAMDVQAQALRSALPRQAPLAPLLANLTAVAAQSEKSADPAWKELAQLARLVIDNLSGRGNVSNAAGLKQAVLNSGVFLEAKLAQTIAGGTASLTGDLKAGLLRLLEGLRTQAAAGASPDAARPNLPTTQNAGRPPLATANTATPLTPPPLRAAMSQAQAAAPVVLASSTAAGAATDMLQQTEGALARLQLSQIASLPNEQQPQRLWTLELPVVHEQRTDLFHLRIEEDASSKRADSPAPWSVMLAFDLPSLGPVHARVLINGQQVSTTLWAERATTTELFQRQLEDLRAGFQRAGMRVGRITCTTGAPAPAPDPGPHPPLVDTRA